MTEDPTSSTTLGRYHLEKRIARGGMGEVWLARAKGAAGWEKNVVIKTILPHLSDQPEFVERFLDEARIATTLSHGNIVPVFGLGQEGDTWFLVMEYVDGWDLRTILRRARAHEATIPPSVALYIIAETCKGLDYAHHRKDDAGKSLNIVHRDISPANILISREGEIRIVDFGIASAKSKSNQTLTGELRGKFAYMSPEQASGAVVDHRSDIFSLGVVLYEMLAGKRPFDGDSDLEVLGKVQRAQYPDLASLRPELDPTIHALVSQALAHDPADRFASAHAMQMAALQILLQETRPIGARDLSQFCLRFDRPTWSTGNQRSASFDALLVEQLSLSSGSEGNGDTPSYITPSDKREHRNTTPQRVITTTNPSEFFLAHDERRPLEEPDDQPTQTVRVDRRAIVRRKRLWWAIGVVTLLIIIVSILAFRAGSRSAANAPLVRISTEPSGALILFNGVSYGRSTLVARIEPGEFLVRAELDNYKTAEELIIYDGKEDLRIHFPLKPLPDTSTLPVVTPPSDGPAPSGTAEPTSEPNDEGVLAGTAPAQAVGDASPSTNARAELEPTRIRLTGLPGNAQIYVNGERQSSASSVRIPVKPDVTLRIEAPGYQTLTQRINGRSVDRQLHVNLAPTATGTLTVRFIGSILTGEVLVDGRSYGFNERSPRIQLALPEGAHRVTIRNPELGKHEEHEVRIRAHEESVLRIDW